MESAIIKKKSYLSLAGMNSAMVRRTNIHCPTITDFSQTALLIQRPWLKGFVV